MLPARVTQAQSSPPRYVGQCAQGCLSHRCGHVLVANPPPHPAPRTLPQAHSCTHPMPVCACVRGPVSRCPPGTLGAWCPSPTGWPWGTGEWPQPWVCSPAHPGCAPATTCPAPWRLPSGSYAGMYVNAVGLCVVCAAGTVPVPWGSLHSRASGPVHLRCPYSRTSTRTRTLSLAHRPHIRKQPPPVAPCVPNLVIARLCPCTPTL